MSTPFLSSYLAGRWAAEATTAHTLRDAVTGEALARTGGGAAGLADGFAFAREHGRAGLQAMLYGERAAMLGRIGAVLKANRDEYLALSLANSGTTAADSAVDVDGALFTLGWYARAGAAFGRGRRWTL